MCWSVGEETDSSKRLRSGGQPQREIVHFGRREDNEQARNPKADSRRRSSGRQAGRHAGQQKTRAEPLTDLTPMPPWKPRQAVVSPGRQPTPPTPSKTMCVAVLGLSYWLTSRPDPRDRVWGMSNRESARAHVAGQPDLICTCSPQPWRT